MGLSNITKLWRYSCRHTMMVLLIILAGLLNTATGDVFCGQDNPLLGIRLRYCYGITAYCCGFGNNQCCWDSIWKIWWFWVVVLVILGALFSCIGYFCTCIGDDWSSQGRVSPFYAIRDGFRRRYSTQESVEHDPYKEYRDQTVLLPPYYPTTNTVPVAGASTSGTYPMDSPPPYTEEPSSERSRLLPVSTTTTVLTTASTPTNTTVTTSHPPYVSR